MNLGGEAPAGFRPIGKEKPLVLRPADYFEYKGDNPFTEALRAKYEEILAACRGRRRCGDCPKNNCRPDCFPEAVQLKLPL